LHRLRAAALRTVAGAAFGSDIVHEQTASVQVHVIEALRRRHRDRRLNVTNTLSPGSFGLIATAQ